MELTWSPSTMRCVALLDGEAGGAVREGPIQLLKIAGEMREIAGKLRCCNQTKLNLPKPQGATILHRSLRMLKQIGSFTGTRSTTTSALNITTKVKHNSFGGRKTLKYLLLQQLFAKAKGTKKHAKWTGRKQLRKNCRKFRKIAIAENCKKNCGPQSPPPLGRTQGQQAGLPAHVEEQGLAEPLRCCWHRRQGGGKGGSGCWPQWGAGHKDCCQPI